ncbi:MAG: GNAT family N-acetyltransferase [Planctomycetes bacterium]|nr:GNAT family N-acetyltransferase [Planctomycetota bacterium]
MTSSAPKPATGELQWHAREPRPDDAAALTAVFNAAFRRHDKSETLEWRYKRNPHGVARTIVAAGARDELAGAYSYIPRKFSIDGKVTTIVQASDAMVFEQWQRKGIFTGLDAILAERAAAEGVPFGFAFCGRRSQKGFLANGWKAVSPYRTWTRILKITKSSFEARKSDGRVRRAMIPIEWWRARSADPYIKQCLDGFRDEPVESFGKKVAELPPPKYKIYGVRDSEYLNWRFLWTPRRTHSAFRLLRGGDVAGYYDIECNSAGRGYLLDARGADESAERAALAAAVEKLRIVGASTVQTTVVEGSFLDTHIRALGFEPPRDPAPLPFIVRAFVDCKESQLALDPKNWYIFDGDRDAESMV